MPQISVIVPVYKVEQFLARCVDSILSQSFEDFELILVDDGSPDNSGAICDDYAALDSRIHVIHQENGGLSAARNAALDWMYANSNSRWIAFVDSDDWIHPDFLTCLYQAAVEHNCRISVCGFFRTAGEQFPVVSRKASQCVSSEEYYCGEREYHSSTAIACNKLYHRTLLENLRYPKGKLHEDEFTTYKAIFAAEKVAVLEQPLYAYYQNAQSITLSKWNPRRMHAVEAFEQQINDALENDWIGLYRKAVKNGIFTIHEQLAAAESGYHKDLRRSYRKVLKQGRQWGGYPLCWDHLWAYEEAYPVKLFWWLVFRGKALWDRVFRKEAP